MLIDVLTVGVGLVSFGVFLFIHVITFRWIRPEALLKSLLACVIVVLLLPMVLMAILFVIKPLDASLPAWVLAGLLAFLIEGLLCFVYVLCVFGPYETSVRMRLVREIARGGANGVSQEDLLQRYGPATIVNIRLRRLTGSGDIVEKDGLYKAGSKRNLFFIFDAIAEVIKKWIEG